MILIATGKTTITYNNIKWKKDNFDTSTINNNNYGIKSNNKKREINNNINYKCNNNTNFKI